MRCGLPLECFLHHLFSMLTLSSRVACLQIERLLKPPAQPSVQCRFTCTDVACLLAHTPQHCAVLWASGLPRLLTHMLQGHSLGDGACWVCSAAWALCLIDAQMLVGAPVPSGGGSSSSAKPSVGMKRGRGGKGMGQRAIRPEEALFMGTALAKRVFLVTPPLQQPLTVCSAVACGSLYACKMNVQPSTYR